MPLLVSLGQAACGPTDIWSQHKKGEKKSWRFENILWAKWREKKSSKEFCRYLSDKIYNFGVICCLLNTLSLVWFGFGFGIASNLALVDFFLIGSNLVVLAFSSFFRIVEDVLKSLFKCFPLNFYFMSVGTYLHLCLSTTCVAVPLKQEKGFLRLEL